MNQDCLENKDNGTEGCLQPVFALLSTCPEGREVLDVIEKLGLQIRMSDLGEVMRGIYHPQNKTIALHTDLSDFEMASTLAHETRHAWQFKTLDWYHRIGTFEHLRTFITISRMLEGDAYAFQGIVEDALKANDSTSSSCSKAQKYLEYFMHTQKNRLDAYDERRFFSNAEHVESYLTMLETFKSPGLESFSRDFYEAAFSPKVRLKELRKICVAGFDLSGENYLEAVSARDLWRAIHSGTKPSSSTPAMNSFSKEQSASYRKIYDNVKLLKAKAVAP